MTIPSKQLDNPMRVYGVLAEFETTSQLYVACERMKKKGFKNWDAHSPFPIHGLDKAAGIPQSKLPWFVGIVAAFCGVGSFCLWTWMNAVDYKYVIAGKPFFSWPAYLLPAFECAVLGAAITCLFGLLILNKLPQWHHSLFHSERFGRASNDKFFISVEKTDPLFHSQDTLQFLKDLGASHVEFVEE